MSRLQDTWVEKTNRIFEEAEGLDDHLDATLRDHYERLGSRIDKRPNGVKKVVASKLYDRLDQLARRVRPLGGGDWPRIGVTSPAQKTLETISRLTRQIRAFEADLADLKTEFSHDPLAVKLTETSEFKDVPSLIAAMENHLVEGKDFLRRVAPPDRAARPAARPLYLDWQSSWND